MTDPRKSSAPSRLMPVAVGAAGALVVVAAGMFYWATQNAAAPERGNVHKIEVGQTTCDPLDLTVPAGRTTFEIHNKSDRTIEWEILDGPMVLEERENIAPGFHSTLTGKLKPGTYEITCGLLSNPRGKLVVTPSAASDAEKAAPPITAFIGPLSEYKVYLATQSGALVKQAEKLDQAIKAGDLEGAKAAWIDARLPYKRMESVTGRFADLENAIDPLSDYLEKREDDPGFTGFHRIEYGLWKQGSTEGLASVSAKLLTDVTALKDQLRALKLAPEDLAGSAGKLADRLANGQIAGGEDHWAGVDLAEIEANLDGIGKGAGLLRPLVAEAKPDAATAYDNALADARAALAALKGADGYPAYDQVSAEQRGKLAENFGTLRTAIDAMNPAIGLE